MTRTSSAGTIWPETQATKAWRATDAPRHGQDDGSVRTSGPARTMKAPPISFSAAFPAFFSPGGEGSPRKDDGAMTLFARLLQAVRSWRRRRGGPKTVRYAGISMEQLDH